VAASGAVNIDRGRLGGASVVVLLADADSPPASGSRFGLVGRLSRDPVDKPGNSRGKGRGKGR
jgi:hypothetical protein